MRGARSAALLVAPGAPVDKPWVRRYDMRVDLSPRPLDDLADLLRVSRAFEAFDAAFDAGKAGDLGAMLERTTEAYALAAEDPRITFWHAMALLANGRPSEAEPMLAASLPRPRVWHPGVDRSGYERYVETILDRMQRFEGLRERLEKL